MNSKRDTFIKNSPLESIRITPEIARLHAHICADGCIYRTRTNRSKKELIQHPRNVTVRNRFHIQYWNNDLSLLHQFKKDVKKAFGRIGVLCLSPKRNRVDLQGKWIYNIFRFLGAGRSHEWFISNKIMSSSRKIIIEWLRTFFDDEAYVPLKRKNIRVSSVNKKGLQQIKKLLFTLKIKSTLLGPYFYKKYSFYRLCINSRNIERYQRLVGFNSTKKKRRLSKIIM